MGLDDRKHVFGIFYQVAHKQACSATETSEKIEISLVACLEIILFNKRITNALIRLRGCTGWSVPLLFANLEDSFSRVDAYLIIYTYVSFTLYKIQYYLLYIFVCLFILNLYVPVNNSSIMSGPARSSRIEPVLSRQ